MIIKYCSRCSGKPYTTDLSVSKCPQCGAELLSEINDEQSLKGRRVFSTPNANPFSSSSKTPNTSAPRTGNSFGGGFASPPSSPAPNGFSGSAEPMNNSFGKPTSGSNAFAKPFSTDNANSDNAFSGSNNKPENSSHHTSVTPFKENDLAAPFTGNDSQTEDSSRKKLKNENLNSISGIVSRYNVTDSESGYKRLFVFKLIDALVYRQRMDDVKHTFTVHVSHGRDEFGYDTYTDIPVCVHGVIAGGTMLEENTEVEVHGKYKNNCLMADRIQVVNSGYRSTVTFQHSRQGILYAVLAVFALAFLIYVGVSSDGGFFTNIKSFFVAWLISAGIVTVLYLLLFFSRIGRFMAYRSKGFPFIGVLLVSFILALLYMNLFGLRTQATGLFSGLLSSVLPFIIVIIVIVVLFKTIFRR